MRAHARTHARGHLFADVQTGERSHSDAVSSVATLLSHSWPVLTYLFGAMAAMTGPLTLRKPPGLRDVPSSSSVKILRAPGLV